MPQELIYICIFAAGLACGGWLQEAGARWFHNLGEEVDLLDLEPEIRGQVLNIVYNEEN